MRKINLLALLAFVASLAWVFTLDRESRERIHSRVLEWFTPIFKAQTAMEGDPEVKAEGLRPGPELAAENAELRRQLSELRIYQEKSDQLQAEINKLNDMLGFVRGSRERLIPARVINRTASNWWNSVVIDRGSEEGVGTDFPVRNEVGIIGKTAQVSPHSSKVILLTDEECQVAALVENTLEKGIVMGTRNQGDGSKAELRMRFLSKDAALPPGLKVHSSGAGGLFPPGVFLGTVREFINGDIYGEAILDPAVDFSTVRDLFVVVQDFPDEEVPSPEDVSLEPAADAAELPILKAQPFSPSPVAGEEPTNNAVPTVQSGAEGGGGE